MAINPTNHTVYQLKGITAFSNEPAVNTRSVDSGHLVIDASASANMLTIEGVTYAYNKQSVNNVLDTQFNYFKFPVQVVYSPIANDVDITVPEQPQAEPEKLDPVFARYKPSESINLPAESWSPIELSDIEDGNAQKKPNKYYINKAIKDENKPLRFRFNWNITVEGITSIDPVIAAIMLLQESPNKTLREKGYSPGWTTGYEWPNLPPDTVPGIKNWGDYVDATLTPGLNTGSLDITVPWWDYDQGDKFSVVIVYYKEQWDTKWHWFGQWGGKRGNYWDHSWENWYRKASPNQGERWITRDESDQPGAASYIRDMKQLVDTDWWEPVLNTYVEPTKRALVERMRDGSGRAPHNDQKRKPYDNWLFDSHGDVFNGYIQYGFSWKEELKLEIKGSISTGTKTAIKGPETAVFAGYAAGMRGKSTYKPAGMFNLTKYTYEFDPEEGHIGTRQGKVDYDQAKAAFDTRDPKIIINADKTWLSVTNAEKQVDVWNRKLKP